jgi:hypothetical protein
VAQTGIGKKPTDDLVNCFEESQGYSSIDDRTAELNIHLEGPASTETVRRELHKSSIHGRTAIAKPLTAESNA